MVIRKAVIITPRIKKESKRTSLDIEEHLSSLGIASSTVLIDSTENLNLTFAPDVDLVIPLGGDGTVLCCARSAIKAGITVLPINLGTFGYITEIELSEWKEALNLYLETGKNYTDRLMLKVYVYRNGKRVFQGDALNEAVISSSGLAKVVSLRLLIDNTFAGNFRSDGMIVATPTGSTGYSLASGGPILDYAMKAIVITPICPFALSNRPLVTGDKTILLEVRENQRTDICLTVDGQLYFELEEKDRIICRMNRKKLRVIHSSKRNFTEVIRDKLHWGGEMVKHD